MRQIILFSILLALGLVGSQWLPGALGPHFPVAYELISFLTMVGLSFIMIHVGYEFELDENNLRAYGFDYFVATTAAAFPWIIAAFYFIFVLMPPNLWHSVDAWKEVLLASRFAAPTATGVLFSMLAAAGLSATWMFRKTRILVIFDDLDTVLLMLPLKVLMVGLAWQLGIVVVIMLVQLWIAWQFLHRIRIPVTWPWVMGYSLLITAASEAVYWSTKIVDLRVPIHIEVLLPAFVLGCIMARPQGASPHVSDALPGHQEGPESPVEQRASLIISACFMLLVGLNMPLLFSTAAPASATVTAAMPSLAPWPLLGHVLALTILINLGKMVPAFCYRKQAHWKERLALAVGMCPRGEVGAGIIILSLSYGIGGPVVSVAVLSLALNLLLTPFFVWIVNALIRSAPTRVPAD